VQFEYHYFGKSEVSGDANSTGLSFAPDTRRPPTYFEGKLVQRLPFREALSALHAVVASDLRFKPRDKSEYLAWRAQQDELDWTEVAQSRSDVQAQIDRLKKELGDLRARSHQRLGPWYRARQQYFDWLYKRDLDAWYVLDPVISVHPDEVSFECFSVDESSYGRVACSYEVFEQLGERACGTTNVDYSAALYNEFQKVREYKDTSLVVDPQGFDVKTTGEAAYREVKIDLPDSWVRGFLQVGSAMTMGSVRFELHPTDVANLLFWLRRNKERHGPRSIRFHLSPGDPVVAELDPWRKIVECPRSIYDGPGPLEVRMWGRRRLFCLERLIPVARSFTVVLLGTGMPSFWLADLGHLSFTLGLSGWTANDWSANGNFDLLAPRAEVDDVTMSRVMAAMADKWLSTADALANELKLSKQLVVSALQMMTQAGKAIFDIHKGVYRLRELTVDPLPMDALRFTSPAEQAASRRVAEGKVRDVEVRDLGSAGVAVSGTVTGDRKPWSTSLTIDLDGRVTGAECTCDDFVRNKLHKGPCEHILALRLIHQRAGRAVS